MPDNKTLAKIHIAKKALGLTEAEYQDILYAHSDPTQGPPKQSSASMNETEAQNVIEHFKSLGWKPRGKKTGQALRFEALANRPGMASPAQLRKIEATWMTHHRVRVKTEDALRRFIKHTFNIEALRFIEIGQVGKILKAIQSLK